MLTEPMRLGAASNFSQGWNEALFQAAEKLPLRNWRDSVRWADVEKVKGRYSFGTPMTRYPQRLQAPGTRLTLTLNWGNPLYDSGHTPHSADALAAFRRFVTELVRRYPAIDTIEIGNEINGNNFVNGPVKDGGMVQRRAYHLAMVRSAAEGVKIAQAPVRVIGGSVHSLPGGFLWPLLEDPAAASLQGLAVHPYTTPIEQLPQQIGVLRRHAGLRRHVLHITEFGSQNAHTAPDELVRAYATLSSLGSTELDWYPLNERGDGFVPLLRRSGETTGVAQAFRLVTDRLASFRARDVSPDRFTFVHAFGPHILVLWGAPRAIRVNPAEVDAFDARGARLDAAHLTLDETRVLVLQGQQPLVLGRDVRLGCSSLIADSFLGFSYPADTEDQGSSAGFTAFVQRGRGKLPLETLPGQQREGVPWTPYLGLSDAALPRVLSDMVIPNPDGPVFLEFLTERAGTLRVQGDFATAHSGALGPKVAFSVDGRSLDLPAQSSPVRVDRILKVRSGQRLAFAVSWNQTARDSTARYRIRLFDPRSCALAEAARR